MDNITVAERLVSKFEGWYEKNGRTVIYHVKKTGEKFLVRFSNKSVDLRPLSEYSLDGCIFMLAGNRIGKVYYNNLKKTVGAKDTVPFELFTL